MRGRSRGGANPARIRDAPHPALPHKGSGDARGTPRARARMKKRVAILISGRGSNMMALVEAARNGDYPAEIVTVISSRPEAPGLAWARRARPPRHEPSTTRPTPRARPLTRPSTTALTEAGVELVALAGFMRIQSPGFVRKWLGRQLNIHPSLLPLFKGLHPQRQALQAGVRISGCSVHFVTEEMDAGPIVAQAAVAVHPGDTEQTLADRILVAEHRLYPHALDLVASGRARLENGCVLLEGAVNPIRSPLFASALTCRLAAQHLWKNRRGDSLELDTLTRPVLPDPKGDKKPNIASRLVGEETRCWSCGSGPQPPQSTEVRRQSHSPAEPDEMTAPASHINQLGDEVFGLVQADAAGQGSAQPDEGVDADGGALRRRHPRQHGQPSASCC